MQRILQSAILLLTALALSQALPAQEPQPDMNSPEMQEILAAIGMQDPLTLPANDAFEVKELHCTSQVGKDIFGAAFIPKDGRIRHPLVIMSHGFSSMHLIYTGIARSLAQEGIACYAFDFCGGSLNSKSEGDTREMSCKTEIAELESILAAAREWDFVDTENIFLMGESQGGFVSAMTAARQKDLLRGIVLLYPAFHIPEAMRAQFPDRRNIPDDIVISMPLGRCYPEDVYDMDTYRDTKAFDKPVLIIHGDKDEAVDLSYSQRALKSYKDAQLKVIPGAGHGFFVPEQREQAVQYTLEYMKRTLCQKADYEVVPRPNTLSLTGGKPFLLQESTRIIYPEGDALMERNAAFLAGYIAEATGMELSLGTASLKKEKNIVLAYENALENQEAYRVDITEKGITVKAGAPEGIFYGIQFLRKATPHGLAVSKVLFPAGTVTGTPQYAWRGMQLDCARHFFDVDFVKSYIDMLALHQINVFHWHLTDDQGWRIQIKKYPRLTEVGSKRSGSAIGLFTGLYDETPVEGFYTQDQIREVVAYAAERFITVVPEVDMPGHMVAALASYPSLGCTGGPYEVRQEWGVSEEVLCLGKDESLAFVKDVLEEVMELFPGKYIHIGGDEAPRTSWHNCPRCRKRMTELGLTDEKGSTAEGKLQAWFTKEMENFLASHGRKAICWDEALEGLSESDVTIMAWHEDPVAKTALAQGHEVIYTPMSGCYFNYYQVKQTQTEPLTLPLIVTVEDAYSLTVPEGVKGVQAQLWGEFLVSRSVAQYQLLPRLGALAEVQWLPKGQRNFDEFRERAYRMTELYTFYGWHYAKHIFPNYTPLQRQAQ